MQQTNELQKLVEAVNEYRDIHSICESVPSANLKDWQKTKLHDAYVNMLIVCDAVQLSGLTPRALDEWWAVVINGQVLPPLASNARC